MRHVCIKCGLSSADGNLWCQRRDCSTVYLNVLFRPGDRLGELEIKGLLRVMRTAAVYRALRGGEPVLVKLAHVGADYIDDIKREAKLLRRLWLGSSRKDYPSFLPRLAAPYSGLDLADDKAPIYGRLALDDTLRYFIVFEDMDGFFLRDLLDDNPQPQYNYAGWLALSLIDILRFLRDEVSVHHGALYPEIVHIRIDKAGVYFPVLFDLGLGQPVNGRIPAYERARRADETATDAALRYEEWLSAHVPTAYTAPELIQGVGGETADMYGVGLIFYEMLAGHPAYDLHSPNQEAVMDAVQMRRWRALPHREEDLRQLVERALRTPSSSRPYEGSRTSPFRTLDDMGQALEGLFGSVPPEKRSTGWLTPRNQTRLMVAALVMLLALVLIAMPTAITSFAVNALATAAP